MKEFRKIDEILDDFWINIERFEKFWIDIDRLKEFGKIG